MSKGAASNISSICGLAVILMDNDLFQCLAYLTVETLKMNKSSYEEAEYQRWRTSLLGIQNGFWNVGHIGMIGWYYL